MADEQPKKAEETKSAEESPPVKSKKMLWILIIAAVVVLGAGGATTAFFLTRGGETVAEGGPDATPAEEPAGLVPFDTFLVNLNDPTGERYMKLTLRLTVSPEPVADSIQQDELIVAQMRDRILTVLMSKTFQELSHPLGKESLRREIQAQVDLMLDDGAVQDVLFSEFVVQ